MGRDLHLSNFHLLVVHLMVTPPYVSISHGGVELWAPHHSGPTLTIGTSLLSVDDALLPDTHVLARPVYLTP